MQRKYIQKMSRYVVAAIVTGSLLINSTPVHATTLNDLSKSSSFATEAVRWLATNNIISGDNQGNFNPGKTISRAEIITLLVKALGIDTSVLPDKATFNDVPKTHWAFKYVEAAYKAGIVNGIGNGDFGIDNPTTREQMATMFLNSLYVSKEAVLASQGLQELGRFKDESKMADWAKAPIQFALSNKLMSGISIDEFSPGGVATKEQVAVVLYKYLNSMDSITKAAEVLRQPIVSFNGDVFTLSVAPVIINDQVLVPSEVFKKIGEEVINDGILGKVVIKKQGNASKNIYLKSGSTTAFVNYTGQTDPFYDMTGASITLPIAPKLAGNDILVPVNKVAEAMGLNVNWNKYTNLITIEDTKTAKNPALYNAIKNTLQYKGEYNSKVIMTVNENISNEGMGLNLQMSGAINGVDSTSLTKVSYRQSGMPNIDMEFNSVMIGNKLFHKDNGTGEWGELSLADAANQGIVFMDVGADRRDTQKLLENYGKINVMFAGKTVLGNENVTKYVIKADADVINTFMPAQLLESNIDLGQLYNNGLEYSIEMYINNAGQIVKQTTKLTGGIRQTNADIGIRIISDIDFINIGKEIPIVNPLQPSDTSVVRSLYGSGQ